MATVDLFGEYFALSQKSFSSQRLVNWIPQDMTAGKRKTMFVPSPGQTIRTVCTPFNGTGCRGMRWSSSGPAPDYSGRLYTVVGNTVFRVKSDMGWSYVGTIGSNANPVMMAEDEAYLYVVDGYGLYRTLKEADDSSLSLEPVDLPNIPGTIDPITPDQLAIVEQRIIINSTNSNQWFYSNAGTSTIDADNFYTAEQSSDKVNGIRSVAGNVWLWGIRSVEIWRGTRVNNAPFSWVGGSGYNIGCKSPKSISVSGDNVLWLGSSDIGENRVYRGAGITIEAVSNDAIDEAIAALPDAANAEGYCYSSGGSQFYVLTFRESKRTFVYDLSTNKWHERSRWNLALGKHEAWEPMHCAFAYGKYYFGMLSSDYICTLESGVNTDYDGNPIMREAICPVIYDGGNVVYMNEIALDMEIGATAVLSGYGEDPKMFLSISRDGGYTFGLNVPRGMGKQGEYSKRARWTNMGSGHNITLRFRTSAPVPCTVYGGELIIETGGR